MNKNKNKIQFIILYFVGIVGLFLPWFGVNSSLQSGVDILILPIFTGSVSSPNPLLIIADGYIIGLILLAFYYFLPTKKFLFNLGLIFMVVGLALDFLFLSILGSFGGDVPASATFGSGFGLSVMTTLIFLAWAIGRKGGTLSVVEIN